MSPAAHHRARLREETIARLAAILAERPPAPSTERVILFGSLARGDFDGASDVDLLVVGEEVPDLDVLGAVGRGCDRVLWSGAQWRGALEDRNPMALEIARDGVELWPSPGAAVSA